MRQINEKYAEYREKVVPNDLINTKCPPWFEANKKLYKHNNLLLVYIRLLHFSDIYK